MLIDGKFYSDPELISYIKKLKNTIAMNEESQKIADGVIEELKQENAELKKYLRLAMRDFERVTKMCIGIQCDSCPHEYMGNYELANGCIWQHKEQVLNLIGGEDNG